MGIISSTSNEDFYKITDDSAKLANNKVYFPQTDELYVLQQYEYCINLK